MKLSEAQEEQLYAFLRLKWVPSGHCPMCQANAWSMPPRLYKLVECEGGTMPIGLCTSIIPLVAVICQRCGNTLLIDGLTAGLSLPTLQKVSQDSASESYKPPTEF